MADGVVMERHEGTPQGGPLSPLLANVLLDEVDKELERRGHAFVRYADDCNVYVRVQRAGERVMERLSKLYAKLRLGSTSRRARWRGCESGSSWASPSGWPRGRRSKRGSPKKALAELKQRVRRADPPNLRAEPADRSSRICGVSRGLEGLLPARGHAAGLRAIWTSGSAIDCERCNSSSGSGAGRPSANCALAGSRPARRLGAAIHSHDGGELRDVAAHRASQSLSSTSWGFPGWARDLNSSNRRMRTRMSGGVGGERRENRRPLSRLLCGVERPARRSDR